MAFNNQVYQHNKEATTLNQLKEYCAANDMAFADVHDDFSTGIDVYINRRAYDIKASDSKKLTIFKRLPNGTEYKPHETHTDVPYLYCLPSSGYCYIVTKKELSTYIELMKENDKLDALLSEYTGDGNYNLCIDIQGLLLMKEPFIKLKGEDPWNILNFKIV